jgi:hypothetical protein
MYYCTLVVKCYRAMKKHLLLVVLLLNTTTLFSQSAFIITGKTNFIRNGKAVLEPTSPAWFYSTNLKNDTVLVYNHSFLLKGTFKHPTLFRLYLFDEKGKGVWTERFFVDSGNQKLTSDSTTVPQDNSYYAAGQGVLIEGSKANDEFVNSFLPLFKHVNDEINFYLSKDADNLKINDKKSQRDSMAKAELIRENAVKTSDSILYEYANKHPKSPIIPWLLYDAAFRHRYSDYYYKTFEKITLYQPYDINAGLKGFLDIQKLKGIGHVFPLLDFIRANTADKEKKQNIHWSIFGLATVAPAFLNSIH